MKWDRHFEINNDYKNELIFTVLTNAFKTNNFKYNVQIIKINRYDKHSSPPPPQHTEYWLALINNLESKLRIL